MHADNVGIKVGDTVFVSGKKFRVTGLIAYVNYATLHEKATDFMFDALKFDVAMVTDEGFNSLHKKVHFAYAWVYEEKPADNVAAKEQSDDFMRALLTQTVVADNEIADYVPAYANPAINFATEDMGSDEAMGGVLLYILIGIISFIFAITINNTIVKEASAIGTLRASGYTRGELIRHYLSMPVIVTLFAAVIGNVLGYTVFKKVVVSMYYNRFRLRILFQNIPNYLVLFVGIFFIMVLLAMAVGMPSTLQYYKDNAESMMFAKYQYVLSDYEDEDGNTVTTDNADAEKFDMTSLQKKSDAFDEEVSVYGIENDSRYVQIDGLSALKEGEVYIAKPFSEKYHLTKGDTVTLDEKYENKQYTFKVAGIYEKCQSIAVFMPIGQFGKVFALKDGQFGGFLSDTEITDLEEDNVATVITIRDITKMCDQLDHSMGNYMTYFQYLCILLSIVMIYLLTKLIIEKNENAISMTKILGYKNSEIAGLYLMATTIAVLLIDVVTVFLGEKVIVYVWAAMMTSYSGWFTFMVEPAGYLKMFAFVLIGYLIVMCFDFNRIRKIPMDEALKNVE